MAETKTRGGKRAIRYAPAALALSVAVLLAPTLAHAAGQLDPSFGNGGRVMTDFGNPYNGATSVAMDSQGRIVASGYTNDSHPASGNDAAGVARYRPNGSLDPSFSNDGRVLAGVDGYSVSRATVDAHDRVVVAGQTCDYIIPHCDFALERYRPNGELDDSFSGDGRVTTNIGGYGWATSVAIDSEGRIVAAGGKGRHIGYAAIARYKPNGSLDDSFSGDGKVISDSIRAWPAGAVRADAQGRVVLAGYAGTRDDADFALARYAENGNLDASFSGDGTVVSTFDSRATSLAIDRYGKIVAIGETFTVARYRPNGTLDPTFGDGGRVRTRFPYDGGAESVAIDSRGRIVAAGYQYTSGALDEAQFALARLMPNGSLDLSFSGNGRLRTDFPKGSGASAVAIDAQDRIVAAGQARTGPSQADFALTRYVGYP
jgi:uncharacterized delta-60 repeat protein